MSLETYKKKRDFNKTSEPSGDERPRASGEPIFVVQKHDARNLHYDVRLEVEGVLKSWAVPKGPSTDPAERRLAIPTEDHPLDYADFEGVIPEDEYGGGTVLVWDRGTYRNLRAEKETDEVSMAASLDEGQVEVWLEGDKLQGGYALIRTGQGEGARWLLIKMDDDKADRQHDVTEEKPMSVLTERTLEEIAAEEGDDE